MVSGFYDCVVIIYAVDLSAFGVFGCDLGVCWVLVWLWVLILRIVFSLNSWKWWFVIVH